MIFIGSCNGARLTRFDPATGAFTRFGRMDETDNYVYPLAGDDGSLAALVKVVRPHLVVLPHQPLPAERVQREVGVGLLVTDRSPDRPSASSVGVCLRHLPEDLGLPVSEGWMQFSGELHPVVRGEVRRRRRRLRRA